MLVCIAFISFVVLHAYMQIIGKSNFIWQLIYIKYVYISERKRTVGGLQRERERETILLHFMEMYAIKYYAQVI